MCVNDLFMTSTCFTFGSIPISHSDLYQVTGVFPTLALMWRISFSWQPWRFYIWHVKRVWEFCLSLKKQTNKHLFKNWKHNNTWTTASQYHPKLTFSTGHDTLCSRLAQALQLFLIRGRVSGPYCSLREGQGVRMKHTIYDLAACVPFSAVSTTVCLSLAKLPLLSPMVFWEFKEDLLSSSHPSSPCLDTLCGSGLF